MFIKPEDTKIGKQMELKKYNAEVKLTKSNKIAECQKRFAQRVEKKEIPSLREWIAKQDKLYSEIQKKIEVSEP